MSLVKIIPGVYEVLDHGTVVHLEDEAKLGTARRADEERLIERVKEFHEWSDEYVMRLMFYPPGKTGYWRYSKCKCAKVKNSSGFIIELKRTDDEVLMYCGLGQSPVGPTASIFSNRMDFTNFRIHVIGEKPIGEIVRLIEGQSSGQELLSSTDRILDHLDTVRQSLLGVDNEEIPIEDIYLSKEQFLQVLITLGLGHYSPIADKLFL